MTPQDNIARTMTMMSDFQVTQVEERHTKIQSDVKEYVLGLAEYRKMINDEDLEEVMRDNLMEEKAKIVDTIDEKRNEREKQAK